jgi:guanylate kinase
MLILLTGPSGSGKTAAILAGITSHVWRVIPTLTTRPPRDASDDSKVSISRTRAAALLNAPNRYLLSEYDSHLYMNELDELQSAARETRPLSIVDWVHYYPTPLERFGPHARGLVLLPSTEELRNRLTAAGRTDRLASALHDHARITIEHHAYPSGWSVIQSDAPPSPLVTHILSVASM